MGNKNNGEDMMFYRTCVTQPKFKYAYRVNDLKFEEFGILPGSLFLPVPYILGGAILDHQIFRCLSVHGFYVMVNEFDLKAKMKQSPEELDLIELK